MLENGFMVADGTCDDESLLLGVLALLLSMIDHDVHCVFHASEQLGMSLIQQARGWPSD